MIDTGAVGVSEAIRALVVRAPGEVVLAARDRPSRPRATHWCGPTWSDCAAPIWRSSPVRSIRPTSATRSGSATSGPASSPATRRWPALAWSSRASWRAATARDASRGETNLCETYDEFGFTRDGAAAGLVAVPSALVHPIAPDVTAEDAVLTEPASVVYRGLTRAAIRPGQPGTGDRRRDDRAAGRLPAPAVVASRGRAARPPPGAGRSSPSRAGAARFETSPEAAGTGYDLVVEAAGAVEAAAVALTAARRGGTVLLLGLPPHGQTVALSVDDVVNNDLAILGSFSYTAAAWRDVVGLLNAGLIRPGFVVTHRFALADWAQAIACLRGGDGPRGKVLLEIGHVRREHPCLSATKSNQQA